MARRLPIRTVSFALVAVVVATCLPGLPAGAAVVTVTGRVSVGNGQTGGYGKTAVSTNGRFVAFNSASKLVAGDTGLGADVFVRDRVAGTTERVSLTDDDEEVGGSSTLCAISDNGRFVAFTSAANNLAGGVYPRQMYLRDRQTDTTEMISVSSAEVPGDDNVETACTISDNGTFVSFQTFATNLGGGSLPAGKSQVYRRDRQLGLTRLVSVSSTEVPGNDFSFGASMSDDGRYVAFWGPSTNLVAGDGNVFPDVFVRDVDGGTTERVSLTSAEAERDGINGYPSISGDGRYVAFTSEAPFVGADTNDETDVFVRDRVSGNTERVSLTSADAQITKQSTSPSISDDGRYVAFLSKGAELVPGHPANPNSVFLRDRTLGTTIRISQSTSGTSASSSSDDPSVASDGAAVAFSTPSINVVPGDTNGLTDVFARDLRVDLKPFDSFDAHIRQQYLDFAGRQPTSGELNLWRLALTSGDSTPDQLIDTLAHSAVWSGRRAPVIRLYWSFFERVPDLGGLNYWTGRLAAGKSIQFVAAQFAGSNEFQTTYGSLSNSAFVTLVYQNIFDRDPDPGGLTYWTGQLNSGAKTRGDVMANFSESSEGKRFLAPVADPILVVLGMVKIMVDLPSLTFWATEIREGTLVIEDVIRGVRVGTLYGQRFP